MRKWVILFFIISLYLLSIRTSQASIEGVALGDFPSDTVLFQSLNPNLPKQLKEIIYLPRESFNNKDVALMINRIGSIRLSIIEKIYQEGIIVNLFSGKLTDHTTTRHLSGKTPRGYQNEVTWDDVPGIGGSKVVHVKIGASEKGNGHGSVNLELHELAHSIDNLVFNNISKTQEFNEIWKQEYEKLFPNNEYFQYHEEYFAEAFAMYYLNKQTKEQLKTKAPLTYQLMESLH
ncbi:toxin [Neobacillus sp.]|jgi:Pro-Pro endopeptidase|uniref:anthrax toxin lethal factor-related metalloendopeptidase n=1 Tax=Neobacillus sp. TaxID=2675273 RepID=UPI0035B54447